MMFARTKRLTLRPGWPEDAPALSRAIGHETVVDKLARAPWPYALEDAETFLALPRGAQQTSFLLCAAAGDTAQIVGVIDYQRDVTAAQECGECRTTGGRGAG